MGMGERERREKGDLEKGKRREIVGDRRNGKRSKGIYKRGEKLERENDNHWH